MHPKHALLVNKEIVKYHKACFIDPIDYFPWLSNIVPTMKPNREIRYCIDFRDLNKALLKDSFPFPHIDMIMDSILVHEILSFMDDFLGYNQIRTNNEDQHKLSFTTPWEIFCWVVIPFGLKNTGENYQKAMVTMS